MKTLLLTAFEPFGGETINPSWEVAKILDGRIVGDMQIIAKCLPCVFGDSLKALEAAINTTQPNMVISLGQAGGRSDITPERVAINIDDARIADNAGKQPIDEPIIVDGEPAYFTTLPVKAMVQALQQCGIAASVSNTAGTFVCNHVFYGLQHLAQQYGIDKSGFIHIPYLPTQAAQHSGQPSMSFDDLIQGITRMIEIAAMTTQDIKIVGGTTH